MDQFFEIGGFFAYGDVGLLIVHSSFAQLLYDIAAQVLVGDHIRDQGAAHAVSFEPFDQMIDRGIEPDDLAVLLHEFDVVEETRGTSAARKDKAFLLSCES